MEQQSQEFYQTPGYVFQKKTQALPEARPDIQNKVDFSFTRGQTRSRSLRPPKSQRRYATGLEDSLVTRIRIYGIFFRE